MPDPNTEHVDLNITSPASSAAPETPSDFSSIAASELAAATPIDSPASDPAPSIVSPATPATPTQSQLDAGIVSHLQTNWGFQPDRIQQFQTPQQVIDYSLQAAYAAQEQLKAREIQYQQHIENLQRQFQQQPQPNTTQQPAQAQVTKKTFNKEYLRYLARDPETGRYVAKTPGAINPQIVDEANEYETQKRNIAEQFVEDPASFIKQQIAEELAKAEERASQKSIEWFQSQQQVQQQQATVQNILAGNKSWMVQYDANGQAIMDASGQRPVLTPQGFEYMQRLTEIEQDPEYSRLSPAKQDQIAKSMMTRVAPPTPQQQAVSRAQAYTNSNGVDAAMHSQSRNGAGTPVFAGAAMPSPDNSFEAIAAREAAEAGIPFSYSQVRTL
jgi:hypothetical protein